METLIGWKSGETTFVPLWDQMETLIGWKSGETTFVPLWDQMETLNGWKSGKTTFVPLGDRMEGSVAMDSDRNSAKNNYLLTYDSYGPVHNRFYRGECITWASGGEGALDTPGPLNGIERVPIFLISHSPCEGAPFLRQSLGARSCR
jgi:hypothetical protein